MLAGARGKKRLDPIQNIGEMKEVFLRLGVATLIGCAIGLNRDLRGKPAGVRTHSLVALGASLLTVATLSLCLVNKAVDYAAVSRVVQGLITGIGFLGAGVILRNDQERVVYGLTTAASIWLACCFGIACGLGQILTAFLALLLAFMVLILGGPLERIVHRLLNPGKPTFPGSEERNP
jgi:putative Mg2+ transporter-C (MgtC) family protein